MSATDTALQMIRWVLAGEGQPPTGDWFNASALTTPEPVLLEAMQQLLVVTAARLGLGVPPLGVNTPLGVNACLLAVALGVRHSPIYAQGLMQAMQDDGKDNPQEWVLFHALVFAMLPFLSQEKPELAQLRADCLRISPLTAVLTRPLPDQENVTMSFIHKLLANPSGRRFLQLAWATPTRDAEVLQWRIASLSRLRQTEDDQQVAFVIDVYEAHMIHFEQETLERIQQARHVLVSPVASQNQDQLKKALLVADWWKPLWEIRRSRNDELRQRKYLGYEYLEGLKLHGLARQMTGGLH